MSWIDAYPVQQLPMLINEQTALSLLARSHLARSNEYYGDTVISRARLTVTAVPTTSDVQNK